MTIRKLFKIFLIFTGSLIVLLLAALVGIQVFLGTGLAGRMIQERINAAIPGRIQWSSQHVSLYRGKIEIHDLSIRLDSGEKGSVPILRLGRLMADVGWLDLFSEAIVVQAARLERPEVSLKIDARGRLNLIRAFVSPSAEPAPESADEGEGFPFNVRVDELILTEGGFSFALPAGDRRIDLENIGLALSEANLERQAGRLELSIRSGRVDLVGIHTPLREFQLLAGLSEGRLDPLRIALRTPESRLRLSGSAAEIFGKPRIDLKLALSAELSEIQRMLRLNTDLAGPVNLEVAAAGAVANPDVQATLGFGAGRLLGREVEKINLQCRMKDRKVDIQRLEAASDLGRFAATGTVDLYTAFGRGFMARPTDLEAIAYNLTLESKDTRLSKLPAVSEKISGQIASHIRLQGRGITPKHLKAGVYADIQGEQIAVEGIVQPLDANLSARADVSDSRVSLRSMLLDARQTEVKLSGDYDWGRNTLDVAADAQIASLDALLRRFRIEGISGSSTFHAEISGSMSEPAVSAQLSARNLGVYDIPVGALDADWDFQDGALRLRLLEIANGASAVSLSGRVALFDPKTHELLPDPVLDLELAESRVYLEDFLAAVLPQITGRVQISGHAAGSLKNPQGRFMVNGRDLETGVQSIPAFDLKSRIARRRIYLEPLSVSLAKDEKVQVQGWIGMDQHYDLQLDADPLDFSSFKILADTDLEGKIELSADGAGKLAEPAAGGRIRLSGLAIGDQALPEMQVHFALRDDMIRAEASEPAAVKADFDLDTLDFAVSADLAETSLAPYFQMAGRKDFAGFITAMFKARGNAQKPTEIQADMNIREVQISYKDAELLSARDFTAELADGRINLPVSRIMLLKEGYIDIGGSGNLNRELEIIARGQIPAEIAEGLAPGIGGPEGALTLDAKLSGTIDQPEVTADIGFEDLGFTVVDTFQQLHAINGKITITNEALTVSSLTGRLDEGQFDLDGTVALEGFMPGQADLRLSARALPVLVPDTLEMLLNANLQLSGKPSKSKLSGELLLLEGLYFRDVNMSLLDTASEIGKRRRQTAPIPREQGAAVPFLEDLSLDVSVGSRNPLTVDNNLALLQIRPELKISGTANVPLVTGRAEVTQGTITYRNTEFEVEKGVVDFINPYQIEPTVDIQARSRVRQWTINLSVSGAPANLDFKLRSDPPEEDADIISLLAVGKTTRELASGEGGASQSPEEMLANVVAGRLEKQVKQGTGLDIVEMEYRQNGAEAEAADEVRVTVGKELSRRLTIKYGVERKAGVVVQQSTAIYKLLEDLSVNAFQDTEGAFGGEMRYRLEFR